MNVLRGWQERWEELTQPRKIKMLRIVAISCYIAALFFYIIYAFGGISQRTSSPAPVVVFMESMPGSLMALRYLAMRPDVSILMIVLSVNAWNVDVNAAHDNVAAFILQLRKETILNYDVPIYYGNTVAMSNERFFSEISFAADASNTTACTYRRVLRSDLLFEADRLFGAADFFDFSGVSGHLEFFDEPLDKLLTQNAADFLILGPATDATWFLQKRPARRDSVACVYFAGGVISAGGDARFVYPFNRYAEQHFFFDPLAAHVLLRGSHGRPVVLVPTDAAPRWPPPLYRKIIDERANAVADERTEQSVARAIRGFRAHVAPPGAPRVSLEVAAAAYFADSEVRTNAVVSEASLAVVNGDSMAKDGVLGNAEGMYKVKLVLELQEKNFWSRFEVLDNFSLVH